MSMPTTEMVTRATPIDSTLGGPPPPCSPSRRRTLRGNGVWKPRIIPRFSASLT